MLIVFITASLFTIQKAHTQSFLFPHGYFDTNKLSALDAFYLHMLAVSTLEHGGTSIEQLDQLWKDRIKEPRPKVEDTSVFGQSLRPVLPSTTQKPTENNGNGLEKQVDREISKEAPPKEPFRLSRAARVFDDDNDDIETQEESKDENPFDAIVTRPPRIPTPIPVPRGFLTRDQILGVYGRHPPKRTHFEQVVRVTTKSSRPQKFDEYDTDPLKDLDNIPLTTEIPTTRRRKLYARLDWSKPHIIELPVPPDFE